MIICAGIFAGITLLTGTGSGGNVFAQRVDENEATASGEARQDGSIQNDRVPDDGARNENVLGDGDQAEKSQEEQGEIFCKGCAGRTHLYESEAWQTLSGERGRV